MYYNFGKATALPFKAYHGKWILVLIPVAIILSQKEKDFFFISKRTLRLLTLSQAHCRSAHRARRERGPAASSMGGSQAEIYPILTLEFR